MITIDMKMPRTCDDCPFLDDYGDYPMCKVTQETRGYNFRSNFCRMNKCPLRELPDHYDYYKSLKEDIKDYLRLNDLALTKENLDEIRDILYSEPSVTGNGSDNESYDTETMCHFYLKDNLPLAYEALNNFGISISSLLVGEAVGQDPWGTLDAIIRLYLLDSAMTDILKGEENE